MLRPPLIAEDSSQRQQHQRQQIKDREDTQNTPRIKSLEKMAVITRVVQYAGDQKTRQRKKQIERAPALQSHDGHVMQQRSGRRSAPIVERKHHRHRQRTESVKGREPHSVVDWCKRFACWRHSSYALPGRIDAPAVCDLVYASQPLSRRSLYNQSGRYPGEENDRRRSQGSKRPRKPCRHHPRRSQSTRRSRPQSPCRDERRRPLRHARRRVPGRRRRDRRLRPRRLAPRRHGRQGQGARRKRVQHFREGLVLFTYLHLAPITDLTDALLEKKVTGIAYETVRDRFGALPLLTPMSEVAGRMSVQVGAAYLEKEHGGRGVLLGGVPGVPPGNVCIIGGGIVGTNAAKIALGMGAKVTLIDLNLNRLRELDDIFNGRVFTVASNSYNIQRAACRGRPRHRRSPHPRRRSPQDRHQSHGLQNEERRSHRRRRHRPGRLHRDRPPHHPQRPLLRRRRRRPLLRHQHARRRAQHLHPRPHQRDLPLRAQARADSGPRPPSAKTKESPRASTPTKASSPTAQLPPPRNATGSPSPHSSNRSKWAAVGHLHAYNRVTGE